MSNTVIGWLAAALLVFGGLGVYAYDQNAVTCTEVPIAYQSKTVEDSNQPVGYKQLTTQGVTGSNRDCLSKSKFISSTVVAAPVDEVYTVGTKQPPKPEPVYTPVTYTQQCEVTLCNDGTCSYSQGRGTCSWHGGVNTYY